jgi:mRNA-degrading endonuclease RelE of RelBE toxin-antitoxin system
MSREVFWTRRARKDLDRADRSERDRIDAAIGDFAMHDTGDVRRLVNVTPSRFRLRVGTWRVIMTLEHPHHPSGELVVIRILRRDKAYR